MIVPHPGAVCNPQKRKKAAGAKNGEKHRKTEGQAEGQKNKTAGKQPVMRPASRYRNHSGHIVETTAPASSIKETARAFLRRLMELKAIESA